MRRGSGATWSPSPPMPGNFWGSWRSRTWTRSRASRRPSPSTRRLVRTIPGRRWARSPRSTTTCGCCMPGWASPTAPSAGGPSRGRPFRRWWTSSWSGTRAPAFSSWRRWSSTARGSTRASSTTRGRLDSPARGLTARSTPWTPCPRWTATSGTTSRSWSTALPYGRTFMPGWPTRWRRPSSWPKAWSCCRSSTVSPSRSASHWRASTMA